MSSSIPSPLTRPAWSVAPLAGFFAAWLVATPSAAIPPRARRAEAPPPADAPGPSAKERAEAAIGELNMRRKIRKRLLHCVDQAISLCEGEWRVKPAEVRAFEERRMRGEALEFLVDRTVFAQQVEDWLGTYERSARVRSEKARESRMGAAFAALEGLEARWKRVETAHLVSQSNGLRKLQARLAEHGAKLPAGGPGETLDRGEAQILQMLFDDQRKYLHEILAQCAGEPWRAWRERLSTLPPGITQDPAPPWAPPPGLLELPLPEFTTEDRWLKAAIGLGFSVAELAKTIPGSLPMPPPPDSGMARLELKQTEMKLRNQIPDQASRQLGRSLESLAQKVELAAQRVRDEGCRAEDRRRNSAEQAEQERLAALNAARREEAEDALRRTRHEERLGARTRAREQRDQDQLALSLARIAERGQAAEAERRQAELDAEERREVELEAAAARLERHAQNLLARAAAVDVEAETPAPDAPEQPATRSDGDGPRIARIDWSRLADKQRDALDAETDESIEEAMAMLRSDGVDLRNRRTRYLQTSDGRVFEIRLRSGRSVWRLLYVHTGPEAIEIVRVVATSKVSGGVFNRTVGLAAREAEGR
jgi:hypothetical protein